MPTAPSNSSSVFGRLTGRKSHVLEIRDGSTQQERFNHSPPADALSDSDRHRLLSGHRRESSIPSIRNSVTDLGSSVRRSVSLRSHRTQHSTSTLGRGPRQPSSSNLLSQTSPTESPTEEDAKAAPGEAPVLPKPDEEQAPSIQHPPRSRGKLSISARSFSDRFKSTDTLVIPGRSTEGAEGQPPLPSSAIDQPKNFSMLVAAPPPPPAIPKRAPPDRPSLASQTSFASTHTQSQANGVSAQHITSLPTPIVPSGGHNPNLIHQSIHEMSNKRMATIDYLRKVHEGNVFYFSTLHYTSTSLNSSIPSLHPHKQGRRATSYLSLGYSLPLLLEMNSGSPTEYLKALSALLSEFETYQSLAGNEGGTSSLSRARVGQMFKTGMGLGNRSVMRNGRRSSAATDSIALDTSKASMLGIPGSASDGGSSPSEMVSPIGHDFNHLLTPHLPFDPDFNTTFTTLCDTLIDTYANLLRLVSHPETCTPLVGEAFSKADKSIRKILVANITREFEDTTRQGVKTEVAGLGRLVLGGLM